MSPEQTPSKSATATLRWYARRLPKSTWPGRNTFVNVVPSAHITPTADAEVARVDVLESDVALEAVGVWIARALLAEAHDVTECDPRRAVRLSHDRTPRGRPATGPSGRSSASRRPDRPARTRPRLPRASLLRPSDARLTLRTYRGMDRFASRSRIWLASTTAANPGSLSNARYADTIRSWCAGCEEALRVLARTSLIALMNSTLPRRSAGFVRRGRRRCTPPSASCRRGSGRDPARTPAGRSR